MTPRSPLLDTALIDDVSVSFTPVSHFDAAGDFTAGTPGRSDNGCWQYGWLPAPSDLFDPVASFTLDTIVSMTWAGIDELSGHYSGDGIAIVLANLTMPPVTIVIDGALNCPVGVLVSGPGPTHQLGAVRFIAPVAGLYDVSGRFLGLNSNNTTVDVHVLQVSDSGSTTASLFSGYVDGYYGGDADDPSGPTPVVPFSLPGLRLAQGDSVFFAMGDGGNGYLYDTTGLEVSVTVSAFGSIGPSGLEDDPLGGYLGGLGYWQDPGLADSAGAGLSYVRQRWLENGTGQWLSVDPVATEPRYGYAHNMPTVRVDPGGTDPWNFYKWVYTGNAYASNETYQLALGQAADTLQSETQTINLRTEYNRKRIRNLIKLWARGGGNIRIPASINNFGTMLGVIHPLLPLKNVSISRLLAFDNIINKKIAAATERARKTLPGWDQIFVPPYPGSQAGLEYFAGFVWGIGDTLAGYANLVAQVAGVIDLIFTICESIDIWETLKKFAKVQWHTLLHSIGNLANLDPFDQGEMAAVILVNLVLLVLAAAAAAEKAAQAARFIGQKTTGAVKVAEEILTKVKSGGRRNSIIESASDIPDVPSEQRINADTHNSLEEIVEDTQHNPKIRSVGIRGGYIDESLSEFPENELPIAEYIAERDGSYVKKLPDQSTQVKGERFGDTEVDGVKTEFKAIKSGTENALKRNVLDGMQRYVKTGRRQAEHFVIDARGTGLGEREAKFAGNALRGMNKLGSRPLQGELKSVRVIGDGYDIYLNVTN